MKFGENLDISVFWPATDQKLKFSIFLSQTDYFYQNASKMYSMGTNYPTYQILKALEPAKTAFFGDFL